MLERRLHEDSGRIAVWAQKKKIENRMEMWRSRPWRVPNRNKPRTMGWARSFASFWWRAQLNLSQQENSLARADIASAATDFSQAQVASQATLNATARVLNLPTLLDFLK
jgi:hypothetical protein